MIESIKKLKKENINSDRMAKPNRDIVLKFGKGELDISGATMDFMMYLSPYVDLDGRIIVPLKQAKYALFMQTNTYNRVLREAEFHRLVQKKGDYYYSNFHILTAADDGTFSYVKLISAYSSNTLRGYSLRNKRLFYYFASVTRMGNWQRIHIENLYKNRIHKDGVGVDYFDTFRDTAAALLILIRDGFIEVKLTSNDQLKRGLQGSKNKEYILKSNTPMLEEKFYAYFDLLKGEKKSRTSLNKSLNRVIQVRISPETANSIVHVNASEREFIQLAESNYIAWNEMKPVNVNYLIGYKNELYRIAGDTGIAIYRNSISRYVKDHAESLLHYEQTDKLANYFMDFYLLKEIEKTLTKAALHEKLAISSQRQWFSSKSKSQYAWKSTWPIVCNNYLINFKSIGALLAFFKKHGSLNHKIILDGILLKNNINYNDFSFNEKLWEDLKSEVEAEYESQQALFLKSDLYQRPIYLDNTEWRRFMIDCAEQGMFVKKEAFQQLIAEKESVQNITEPIVKRVPFYNWLVERD